MMDDSQSPTTTESQENTVGTTVSTTANSSDKGPSGSGDGDNNDDSDDVELDGDFGRSFPSEDVVLRLSDLSGSYQLSGETHAIRSTASGEDLAELRDMNAVIITERAFESSGSSNSQLVFSSVIIFESPEAAERWLSGHLNEIDANGGQVSTRSVSAGLEPQEARFDSGESLRSVALYERRSNVVYYVAVASDTEQGEYAESLFVKMTSDLP